ncbi:hypothetical protein [Gordonibacter sp. An230]|uniref:hypothetical protein n=1 Tax=Gordonibacter sp. An230 TaxID=1965592 RepID=UPI000B36684A|nr:hypothetical protein [Gordonibacter sp. An230]
MLRVYNVVGVAKTSVAAVSVVCFVACCFAFGAPDGVLRAELVAPVLLACIAFQAVALFLLSAAESKAAASAIAVLDKDCDPVSFAKDAARIRRHRPSVGPAYFLLLHAAAVSLACLGRFEEAGSFFRRMEIEFLGERNGAERIREAAFLCDAARRLRDPDGLERYRSFLVGLLRDGRAGEDASRARRLVEAADERERLEAAGDAAGLVSLCEAQIASLREWDVRERVELEFARAEQLEALGDLAGASEGYAYAVERGGSLPCAREARARLEGMAAQTARGGAS